VRRSSVSTSAWAVMTMGAAVNSPSSDSDLSFIQMKLTGPPGAVDRLMVLLSGKAEVIFDSRSGPDARGEVTCTAEVVTHPGHDHVPERPGRATVTLQAVLDIGLPAGADFCTAESGRALEEDAARLLGAVPGSSEVRTRLVSCRPGPSRQP